MFCVCVCECFACVVFLLFPYNIQHIYIVMSIAYSMDRLKNLLRIDVIRILRLCEISQYTILYAFVTLLIAPRLDKLFPTFDKKKSSLELLIEIIIQLTVVSIIIFYIRKIVKIIPPIGSILSSMYKIGTTSEYNGGIIIGLVLVHSQYNLSTKLEELKKRIEKAEEETSDYVLL